MNETSGQSRPGASEQPVGQLAGDRLCLKCHYNLAGQSIVREPKYHLLIVRCPECGAVAPLQEYPALGRWSRRWAAVAAALLIIVLVALWLASAGTIFGLSVGAVESSAGPYAQYIESETRNLPREAFPTWWQQQDHARLLREAGGWRHALDWPPVITIALVGGLVCMALGVFWSVALIARSWPTLLACALVIGVTALLLGSFNLVAWLTSPPPSRWSAAQYRFGPVLLPAAVTYLTALLFVGALLGRPVARGLVRLLLPPRLWMTMHWLWTTRGLQPPQRRISTRSS